ncbi:cobalt-precorrin-5B (C(1))-methyltransferase CbiD [Enterocloster lavalensis]|uniref:Cobalt-precorrin-5B C(1)-methyltransferase n=3 Tax=Enterocloster TaxID=2719313 RepID=A0A1I0C781_9FIRM|nr:cobalt-precorrin-5B (C(1))-methyltransferase CbiD [Enterocloster lavalensis]PST34197.1 cobalamin biosynthesis protein CbiD [Enterocloster lavalensis]SET15408.1 cobalt-precorrin 5B C1-methyltransferase [Enterocloster lavalensis]
MENTYIYKQQKKLRCGYTTGTCAAAASMAAAAMLLGEEAVEQVSVETPGGVRFLLSVEEIRRASGWVSCAVRKDGGDDPDVTHGMQICARVGVAPPEPETPGGWYEYENGGLTLKIKGGVGIGLVTKAGLSCEVGKHAINPVPRDMIFKHVERVCTGRDFAGTLWIVIFAPEGEARALDTFNSRLGIRGGISILGTTGIVEPMSEAALLATIRLDIRQQAAGGPGTLVLTPGNYGETFVRERLGLDLDRAVKCSNYIGASIDMAVEEGIREVLLVGHAGKLVKVAAGIMNTHSSVADGRMEILAAHGAACGAGPELVEQILESITVDQALEYMEQVPGLGQAVMDRVIRRMDGCLRRRAGKAMKIEAVVFTNARGLLGRTKGADGLIEKIKAGG